MIYDKPSDRLKQMLVRGRKQYHKEFWALKDVSFKIKKGETVGINWFQELISLLSTKDQHVLTLKRSELFD